MFCSMTHTWFVIVDQNDFWVSACRRCVWHFSFVKFEETRLKSVQHVFGDCRCPKHVWHRHSMVLEVSVLLRYMRNPIPVNTLIFWWELVDSSGSKEIITTNEVKQRTQLWFFKEILIWETTQCRNMTFWLMLNLQ